MRAAVTESEWEIIKLCKKEGLTTREIASVIGRSSGTITKVATNGPRKLCPVCKNGYFYRTNTAGVCTKNKTCRMIYEVIRRHGSLTIEAIPDIPEKCPACLKRLGPKSDTRDSVVTWSLDRVRPNLGYIRGNVQWLCMRCNRIKNNATLDELRGIVSYLERVWL